MVMGDRVLMNGHVAGGGAVPASTPDESTGRADTTGSGAVRPDADHVVHTSVRDVLDYFEKCPRCGYPAQAYITVQTMDSGAGRSIFQAQCGLPCGWRGVPRISPSMVESRA